MTKKIKLSTILNTGKLWEKNEKSRTYLDPEEAAYDLGFFWTRYSNGYFRRATFEDDEISKWEMQRVLNAMKGVYYDNHSKKLTGDRFFWDMLKAYDIEVVNDLNDESEPDDFKVVTRKLPRHVFRTVRLTLEQDEVFKTLGAGAFLQDMLDSIVAGTVAIPVDTSRFTDEEKSRFVEGWERAGGPTDDAESSTPWCAPWFWQSEIVVKGTKPEEWGADWFRQCRPEIEAIRAEDEEGNEE